MVEILSRRALARVLQSLLKAELAKARGQRGSAPRGSAPRESLPADAWLESSRITGRGPLDLGCDSLEALWLSSAACEMFDLAAAERHHALAASDRFGEWLDIIECAWRDGLGTITFATSGSTGTPKRCTHKLANLCDESRHFAGLYGDRRRVLAFVPAHHIYGFLFTALLPDALDVECLDIAEATEALGALRSGDLIVAFPERWRWIERVVRPFSAHVMGVTSTAPCPPDLVEALITAGLAGLTEVYGSSETAGVGYRRWPKTTYLLLPRWSFATEDGDDIIDTSGVLATIPDAIRRFESNAFIPMGRRDGAVQVGGVNVYPERIAAALCKRPGVADAVVRLMQPLEGSRLKAFVVADGSIAEEALHASLSNWFANTMDAASRPAQLRFGAQLPRNEMGKLADW